MSWTFSIIKWHLNLLDFRIVFVYLQQQFIRHISMHFACLSVGTLKVKVPATCRTWVYLRDGLLTQVYMLPHWNGGCWSNLLSRPVTVYWHCPNIVMPGAWQGSQFWSCWHHSIRENGEQNHYLLLLSQIPLSHWGGCACGELVAVFLFLIHMSSQVWVCPLMALAYFQGTPRMEEEDEVLVIIPGNDFIAMAHNQVMVNISICFDFM